jgi:hypothetical protein
LRETLALLVRSDPGAARLFSKIEKQAAAAQTDPGNPIIRITTAGKLQSDAEKIESRAALHDMPKVAALAYAYAVSTNAQYSSAAKRIILAWARINQPTGLPVDETKLEPLFVAYGLTQAGFSEEEREATAAWLHLIAQREREAVRPDSMTAFNNWNSHRLKIVGLIGLLLDDHTLVDYAITGFKKQIELNLLPDGSSFDFHERDALHYHCYDLEPLLTLAIAAHQHGIELYDYRAPNGASLHKSVSFLIPYCDGTSTHLEWVNSKVAFDRKRAAAGDAKFEIGGRFNPQDALPALDLASYFDPTLKNLVCQLAGAAPGTKFPTWQSVLNEAGR